MQACAGRVTVANARPAGGAAVVDAIAVSPATFDSCLREADAAIKHVFNYQEIALKRTLNISVT